jgi:hypothetical protein
MDFTERDLEYIRANYVPLEQAVREAIEHGVLPQPSYVLPDGTEMVPADYFSLVDVRTPFVELHRAAGGDPANLEEDWEGYMSGIYGVCLRDVTPAAMIRKTFLVESLTSLLDEPRRDAGWQKLVRSQVEELDELEREFAPDYDRDIERFGRPPSRDLLIKAARERFPELFTTPVP